jgi:predicted helicase
MSTPSSRSSRPGRPRTTTRPLPTQETLFSVDNTLNGAATDAPFSDRPYQVRGVAAVVKGLANGGRGQLRSACGTGKTRMALWSAQRLAAAGDVVVIAVPTVSLVAQTLRMWQQVHGDTLDVLAVCSDDTVAENLDADEDSFARVKDITEPTTTDSDVLAAWLTQPRTTAMRVVVSTHISCHILAEGFLKARTVADLLIVDEAHRTAGRTDKRTALLHDDEALPARRRLYMTATPRVYQTGGRSEDTEAYALSMDDESVFGPVLFNYPLSQAIADGYLDDYRVAVIGVTKPELHAALRRISRLRRHAQTALSDHTVMVQAALARAAAELDLRSVIAFCPRIDQSKLFVSTFSETLKALPARMRPKRPVRAAHIDGSFKQAERDRILAILDDPDDDGWAIVSNSRCLSEGVEKLRNRHCPSHRPCSASFQTQRRHRHHRHPRAPTRERGR